MLFLFRTLCKESQISATSIAFTITIRALTMSIFRIFSSFSCSFLFPYRGQNDFLFLESLLALARSILSTQNYHFCSPSAIVITKVFLSHTLNHFAILSSAVVRSMLCFSITIFLASLSLTCPVFIYSSSSFSCRLFSFLQQKVSSHCITYVRLPQTFRFSQ